MSSCHDLSLHLCPPLLLQVTKNTTPNQVGGVNPCCRKASAPGRVRSEKGRVSGSVGNRNLVSRACFLKSSLWPPGHTDLTVQRKERLGCLRECRASLNQRRLHSSRGPVREADADPFLHRNLWGSKLLCCKQSLWGPVAVPAEPGSAGPSCLFLRPQGWRMG